MSFSVVCLKFSDTAVRYSRQLSIVSMLLTADSITSSFFKRSIGFLPAFLPSLLSYLARLSSLCLLQLFLRRSRRFFEIYSCRRADEAESSQELVDIMFLLFHNSSVMNINSAICCYGDLGYSKKLRMVLLSLPLDIFWPQIERKHSEEYLVTILAIKRKLWVIFLPRVHLEKMIANTGESA